MSDNDVLVLTFGSKEGALPRGCLANSPFEPEVRSSFSVSSMIVGLTRLKKTGTVPSQ
jgi:hypothetical protein